MGIDVAVKTVQALGLGTTLVLAYIYIILPKQIERDDRREKKQNEREEQREKLYLDMIQQFIDRNREDNKQMREDNKAMFKNIDENLLNLFALANDKKELDSKQIKGLLAITISNTITSITQKIINIIDANNLINNEDEILKDITNIINNEIRLSREFLYNMDVPEKDIEIFSNRICNIKKETYECLAEYFVTAVFELREIKKGMELTMMEIHEAEEIKEALKFFIEYLKKRDIKDADYIKLKRRVLGLVKNLESRLHDEL